MPNTVIDLSRHPVTTDSGETLAVSGWLAMAKDSYKHEETAGVRIYARNKLVATTRDFEQPAGFTGSSPSVPTWWARYMRLARS